MADSAAAVSTAPRTSSGVHSPFVRGEIPDRITEALDRLRGSAADHRAENPRRRDDLSRLVTRRRSVEIVEQPADEEQLVIMVFDIVMTGAGTLRRARRMRVRRSLGEAACW